MRTLAIGEFKSRFSSVLADIKSGHPVAVTYGKSRRRLAVLLPYARYHRTSTRRLGLLENKAKCTVKKDFAMSDEEFVKS